MCVLAARRHHLRGHCRQTGLHWAMRVWSRSCHKTYPHAWNRIDSVAHQGEIINKLVRCQSGQLLGKGGRCDLAQAWTVASGKPRTRVSCACQLGRALARGCGGTRKGCATLTKGARAQKRGQ